MSITNLLKVAMTAIMSNKFRSFLSMLGIIIGVAAVIIMMAIGQGSKQSIREDLSKMGTNLLTIRPGGEMRGGVRLDPSAMQTLKQADYESILNEATLVTHVSPEVTSGGQVIYGSKNTNSTMYGESPDYMTIKLWDIKSGDCFTEEDVLKSAKVCVVGTTIVKELFGSEDADCVGKVVRFKSIPFRIVGVLKSKGYNNWGMDQDNVMIAPYTTVMKRIAAQTFFSSIVMSALTEELSDKAIEEVTQYHHTHLGCCGSILALGGWHRHHEHHARQRDRTNKGNRIAHERRCKRHRHHESVPHRECHDIADGSLPWRSTRVWRELVGKQCADDAQQRALLERGPQFLHLCLHWHLLWLRSCPKSSPHGPD